MINYNTKPRSNQINTAIVGTTPEVQEFNGYTPFNKPASIVKLLHALPADERSSPYAAASLRTQTSPPQSLSVKQAANKARRSTPLTRARCSYIVLLDPDCIVTRPFVRVGRSQLGCFTHSRSPSLRPSAFLPLFRSMQGESEPVALVQLHSGYAIVKRGRPLAQQASAPIVHLRHLNAI